MLGASHGRQPLPGHAFADKVLHSSTRRRIGVSRQAVPGRGDFWGGEERRLEVGARQRAS
jgi:hypothetical protein